MAIGQQSQIDALQAQVRTLEEELRIFKEYDSLTGLYNKDTFYQKVRERLDSSPGSDHVIICLDIERFRVVNEMYGPVEGDRLLCHVAEMFHRHVEKSGGIAARLVKDIFVLYAPIPLLDLSYIENEALDWCASYPLGIEIIPAIGVNVIEDTSVSVSVMCDRALIALDTVKGNYIKHIAEYHNDFGSNVFGEVEIFNCAERALKERQFQIFIQPKCNIDTGRIVGSEALVRWNHPERGLIPPTDFIPVFEKSGFILKLDAYVWEEVCRLVRNWIDSGHRAIPISVNVSRRDLLVPNLCERLVRLVEKYDISPHLLELEITETAYADNTDQILAMVDSLRAHGFVILMDDFGSGYSSLNMLKDINVDILKIDLRFLEDLGERSKKGHNILESIVHMSKWLNMQVIAEGVETKEQVDFLLSIGCYYAQGYYFYKPMPSSEYERLLLVDDNVDYDYSVAVDWKEFTYEDLFQSGTMSQILLNNILGGIALYEYYQGELTLQRVNDSYYSLTNTTERHLRDSSRHIFDFIHKDDRVRMYDALDAAYANQNEGVEFQVRRYCPDGQLVWLHLRLFFLAENAGRKLYYASIHNITRQQESEMALRLSEARFRLALNASKNILFDYDIAAGTIVSLNEGDDPDMAYGSLHYTNVPDCFIEKDIVYSEDIPRFLEMYRLIRTGTEKASCEARFLTVHGGYEWKRLSIQRFDASGTSGRAFGLMEDISRQKRLEERLATGEKLLEDLHEENQRVGKSLLHETIPCGMIGGYCEDGFPVYFINGEMLKLLGYGSYEDFVAHTGGLVSNTIHPEDLPKVSQAFASGFAEGAKYTLKYRTLRKDGSWFWTLDKGRIVRAEDGRLSIISVCLDITEQEELRDELNTIVANTPGDIVTFSIEGDSVDTRYVSLGLAESLGYTRQEYSDILEKKNGKELTYPPDREAFREHFFKNIRLRRPLSIDFRSRRKDGSLSWTNLSARCQLMEDDRCSYHGIYTDVTALKEKEERLLVSDKRFQIALNLVQASIWEYHFDTKTIVQFHQNQNWIEGADDIPDVPESLIRSKVIHPDSAVTYKMLFLSLENGRSQNSSEIKIRCADGNYHWFLVTCTVVQRREDGHPLLAIGISESIDAQKRQILHYNELLKNSQLDSLTGLLNREAFQRRVDPILENNRAINDGSPALLMMDVDNFKKINDGFGHVKGDEILRLIGTAIFTVFGQDVLAGRLGGDEFAVLLENTAYESDVYALAQQFCDLLNHTIVGRSLHRITLTASVGIVFLKDAQQDFNDLYRKADMALYHAKSLGKNTYSVYVQDERSSPALYFNMDTSVLNELDDPIYIIDQETYNLLYCNAVLLDLHNLSEDSWHGRHCYELFQHRTEPCEDCVLRHLRYDRFLTHDYYFARSGRTFEVKEKLIRWNGRDLRLEIAKCKE